MSRWPDLKPCPTAGCSSAIAPDMDRCARCRGAVPRADRGRSSESGGSQADLTPARDDGRRS